MDIKAVTLEEARTLERFLTEISFGAPGTIDAQVETLLLLSSFRAKVRQAIAEIEKTLLRDKVRQAFAEVEKTLPVGNPEEGEGIDDETSSPRPGE
ncbi:MAG TPA: hypothetical protein VMX14_03850 [Anaerolineae bacterium]|nr:hypothetical protein [Anaerolineae bacterium]HUW08152.1 hypothetical protein [Anaerolineae bacterium]